MLYRETERVEGSQKFHRRMHFLLVEAAAEHLALTAIDIDGTVLDRITIPLGSG